MRVPWVTDPHLNFVSNARVELLFDELQDLQPSCVLLGGDIAEAPSVMRHLGELSRRLGTVPICFVLGNHDYYHGGSILAVRESVKSTCRDFPALKYLSDSEPIVLSSRTLLVGHDGWGDARLGNLDTRVRLSDFRLIEEFMVFDRDQRRERLRQLGDEAAAHIGRTLHAACRARPELIVLLTHVPPFREAAWYEGYASSEDYLPYFCCGALGEAVLRVTSSYPDQRLLILCGHTHGCGVYRPRPNIEVVTGSANYGQPRIQAVFDLP